MFTAIFSDSFVLLRDCRGHCLNPDVTFEEWKTAVAMLVSACTFHVPSSLCYLFIYFIVKRHQRDQVHHSSELLQIPTRKLQPFLCWKKHQFLSFLLLLPFELSSPMAFVKGVSSLGNMPICTLRLTRDICTSYPKPKLSF